MPAANLLGERGRGFAQFLQTLDEGRIAIAALATGLAQGCVDESVRYAQQRQAFGQPIGTSRRSSSRSPTWRRGPTPPGWPGTTPPRRLVDGEDVQAAGGDRQAARERDRGDNAREATQIHGGYGFMNEFPVARFWRDAKVLEIGEGTSEVQRMIIARDLGL